MTRSLLAPAGLAALAAAWLGIPAVHAGSFAAHMTMHMGVVAVAAPLFALGVAGSRLDPVTRWPALFSPVPASVVELVVVWAWHAPALHHAARHSAAVLVVEQATFLASGLFVWLSALGGQPHERSTRRGGGILALLLTFMHMTLLGALLALAPRPLYPHADPSSLDPLHDQNVGGVVMLLVGGLSYLAGALGLVIGLLRERPAPRPASRRTAVPAANADGPS
jgi:putative membrane protein